MHEFSIEVLHYTLPLSGKDPVDKSELFTPHSICHSLGKTLSIISGNGSKSRFLSIEIKMSIYLETLWLILLCCHMTFKHLVTHNCADLVKFEKENVGYL